MLRRVGGTSVRDYATVSPIDHQIVISMSFLSYKNVIHFVLEGVKEGFGNTLLCNIVTGKQNNIAFCTCTN